MKIKYYPAKDNPMFPPEFTLMVRFVRPEKAMKCAMCGKKTKKLWTMLVPFKPQNMQQFKMDSGDELKALTVVCEKHPMAPTFSALAKTLDKQKWVIDSDQK